MTLHAVATDSAVTLARPIETGMGDVTSRPSVLLELTDTTTDPPVCGRGEVAPLPGWSNIGFEDARSQVRLWATETTMTGRAAPCDHLAAEVRAAIDVAQSWLEAERAKTPLWRVLGGKGPVLAASELLDGATTRALRTMVEARLEGGARAFKFKVATGRDAERLAMFAEVFGHREDCRIRLDANGAWSVTEARSALDDARRVLGTQLEFVEDPVASVGELRSLRPRTDVTIAADDLYRSAGPSIVDERLVDVVVLKPTLTGPISATVNLASRLRDGGVDVVLSSLHDGCVMLRAWCHLGAALGGPRAHGLGTAGHLMDAEAADLIPVGGTIRLG